MSEKGLLVDDSSSRVFLTSAGSDVTGKSARRRTILVIEDDTADFKLLEHKLSEADAASLEVERAKSLSEGLGRLADGGIDVVLLDLGHPDSWVSSVPSFPLESCIPRWIMKTGRPTTQECGAS